MGREEDEEAAREARRAAIRAEISNLRDKIRRLNIYKQKLNTEKDTSEDEVYTPGVNYDFTAATDIAHWMGKLEYDGEERKTTTVNGVNSFMCGIKLVIGTIESVIARIEEQIASLERELASI